MAKTEISSQTGARKRSLEHKRKKKHIQCVHVYVYIYIYIYMCVHIYIYIYIYTYVDCFCYLVCYRFVYKAHNPFPAPPYPSGWAQLAYRRACRLSTWIWRPNGRRTDRVSCCVSVSHDLWMISHPRWSHTHRQHHGKPCRIAALSHLEQCVPPMYLFLPTLDSPWPFAPTPQHCTPCLVSVCRMLMIGMRTCPIIFSDSGCKQSRALDKSEACTTLAPNKNWCWWMYKSWHMLREQIWTQRYAISYFSNICSMHRLALHVDHWQSRKQPWLLTTYTACPCCAYRNKFDHGAQSLLARERALVESCEVLGANVWTRFVIEMIWIRMYNFELVMHSPSPLYICNQHCAFVCTQFYEPRIQHCMAAVYCSLWKSLYVLQDRWWS